MVFGDAGERIAGDTLQERLQVGVGAGDAVEELMPQRALCAAGGSGRRDLGHVVGLSMGSQAACPQVDRAAWGVQQPGVGIPLRGGRGVGAIRLGEPFDRGDGLRGGDRGADLGMAAG